MSKGLEALKEIELKWQYGVFTFIPNFELIEKELKRLDELDNGAYVPVHINRYNELCDKEKALEIIKEKICLGGLCSALQETKNFEDYKVSYFTQLTQEEYDLLKEVLL